MRKTLDVNEVLNEINTSVSVSARRTLFSLQTGQLSEGASCPGGFKNRILLFDVVL